MRRVTQPPEPTSLRAQAAEDERERARVFFADAANRPLKFPGDFKAYKADDVKATLEDVFHGKCAYCESPFHATQPLDVEHYRPKGQIVIDGKRQPPGYWWLASMWENLLPSCTDCNRPRGQDFPIGKPATAGKANQFPLSTERSRAQAPGGERKERRLLLHPYLDDPEEHLRWVWDKGTIEDGEIQPRHRGVSKRLSRFGKASIEVYALQRLGLIESRRERLRPLVAHLERAKMLKKLVLDDPGNAGLRLVFDQTIDDVAQYTDEASPYSTMCRQVVAEFGASMF
jgi:uncharacterized protein (TIGR02646 family)